jgi:16S rRNA (cytosine967-C5)-methyltransferase
MARSAARQLALKALQRWRRSREFADSIVQRLIVGSEQPRSDRGFAQELFYGVLRNLTLLDFFISQLRKSAIDDLSRDLVRLGLYQLFHLRTPAHAAVFETVELASPHRRSLINGIMRHAAREHDRLRSEATRAPLHIRESHPEFLVMRWREAFGENGADAICRWNNRAAPIYARINTLRIRREDFLENNPMARPISAHSLFVQCEGLPEATIARGDCYIQDPSSAMAVDLLEPQSGEMILDACAAPGGKTSYMAAITKNTASIVACDRDAARLRLLRQNLSHLGAAHIDVIQHDWLHDGYPVVLRPKQFDKILIDAPCTNTGVMRRRVDVRWRLKPADFRQMHEQQLRIVAAVIPLLRSGGVLVYSTCSLECEENEELIEHLTQEVSTLKIEQTRTILPWRDHFDGAFAARFVLAG